MSDSSDLLQQGKRVQGSVRVGSCSNISDYWSMYVCLTTGQSYLSFALLYFLINLLRDRLESYQALLSSVLLLGYFIAVDPGIHES